MIRQERLRGFLVGALLISVTSAQDFAIRGDDEPPWYLSAGMILVYIVGFAVFAFAACKQVAMNISSQTNATQIRATPTTLPTIPAPTPMQLKGQALARRPLVLAVLFPDEGKHEGDGVFSGRNLKYDEQSQRYIIGEDPTEATSCSICMEALAPEDDTVTCLCSHINHRECLMHWLQVVHDECPNCRQPMWDAETYKMVDQQIMDQNSARPSAPLDNI